jgi:uncharacterized protein (TIGR03083 family)
MNMCTGPDELDGGGRDWPTLTDALRPAAHYGRSMARLTTPSYLEAIQRESARFREVLTDCDPAALVPSCPDWRAADLLWHLGHVQDYWSAVVESRPENPHHEEPPRPGTYAGLLDFFDQQHARLVSALRDADPADSATTWKSDDQTVAFIFRRQAHEALIHRLDAELAAGQVTPLDQALASDGVEEILDVMFGGCPPWGTFAPLPHYVRFDLTDTDQQVWVQIGRFSGIEPDSEVEHVGEDDIHVVDDPRTEPDAVVEGPAGALDAWLWRRGDDSEIKVHGDRAVYDHVRLAVNHPII